MKVNHPFRPKSIRSLIPGQFWAISLESGKYACGRVIELAPKGEIGSNTLFLAGLMDWISDEPPTFDSIAGHNIFKQGTVHIKTIHETSTDGMIHGYRPLGLDAIESDFFRSQEGFHPEDCLLLKGFKELRPIHEKNGRNMKHSVHGVIESETINSL